jgi:hypothetical protein
MKKYILLLLFIFSVVFIEAHELSLVINAIAKVESNNNPNAVNGRYVGLLQISPICVEECNTILKKKGIKHSFKLKDRYCPKKSKEMFLLIQKHYNPENNIEKAIRIWNGGPNYSVLKTNRYYAKVKKHLK